MRERIFFNEIGKGTFEDGRIRLYVVFRDKGGNEYEWTPKWREEVIKLFDEASKTEAINRPDSEYLKAFAEMAKRVFGRLPFMEGKVRIGILVEIRGNELIFARLPEPRDLYSPAPAMGIYQFVPSFSYEIESLKAGFEVNKKFLEKFLGEVVIVWIIEGVAVKITNGVDEYPQPS